MPIWSDEHDQEGSQKYGEGGNGADMQNVNIFTQAGFFKPKFYSKVYVTP